MSDFATASRRINLRQMRAIVAISQHRNFTQAAQVVGLSQPAFSALIAQLESELEVRLVDRTTRSISLTPAGIEFIAAARRILEDVEVAVRDAQGHAQLRRGRLTIAALPSLCIGSLPRLLGDFSATYPDIQVSVMDLLGEELVQAAMSGKADFGLGYVGPDRAKDLEVVFRDRLVAIGCPELLPGKAARIGWRNLEGRPIIAMALGSSVRQLIDIGSHQAGADLTMVIEPVQIATALAYARGGLGISILPSSIMGQLQNSGLVMKELIDPAIERPICIIRPGNVALTPAAEVFLQTLRNEIGAA
ncbi:LysR family transcriptional regulator [uncultured Croceicoccus sp.]|uniref:LysR family transcriptional regulator n=1 Tax=uncultured Croceicoccus sp. TaxID=1295329 RepID=UPI002625BCF8|nr:LysR family transcriptional regulator [uncultured Croceicoccus sp.]